MWRGPFYVNGINWQVGMLARTTYRNEYFNVYWECIVTKLEVDLNGSWAWVHIFGIEQPEKAYVRIQLTDLTTTREPPPLPLWLFSKIRQIQPENSLMWHPSYDLPPPPAPPELQSAVATSTSNPTNGATSTRSVRKSRVVEEERNLLRKEIAERFVLIPFFRVILLLDS